jgi:hypothetical protein
MSPNTWITTRLGLGTHEWEKINKKLEKLFEGILRESITYDPELKSLLTNPKVTSKYVFDNLFRGGPATLFGPSLDALDDIAEGKDVSKILRNNIFKISKWHPILKALIQYLIKSEIESFDDGDYLKRKRERRSEKYHRGTISSNIPEPPLRPDEIKEIEKIKVRFNKIKNILIGIQKELSAMKGGMRTRKLRSKKKGTRRH